MWRMPDRPGDILPRGKRVNGQAASKETGAFVTLERLLASDGTATHPHAVRLAEPRALTRDLGDAVHALCTVHGHHPDLLTIAAAATAASSAREWLTLAGIGFAADRAALARLAAAAGPLPSTPGNAVSATALVTERQTLELLARSERVGVAAGAASALVGDWHAVRTILARAADRFGVDLSLPALPDPTSLLAATPERAAAFGAQQLLAQHRGLWSLLEARSSARAH